jgi:hypothetical protein
VQGRTFKFDQTPNDTAVLALPGSRSFEIDSGKFATFQLESSFVQVFAEPGRVICFSEGSSEFNSYLARFDAAALRYHTVEVNAAGGHEANTFGSFTELFDALPDEKRLGPIMVNIGELTWLLMLSADYRSSPSSSWYTTYLPTVQEELDRLGLGTASGSTPISTYKQAAVSVIDDCISYALERGASKCILYGTTGPHSFSQSTGPPRAGFYSSPPDATRSWWYEGGDLSQPGLVRTVDNGVDNQQYWAVAQAQRSATAHGVPVYSFLPDGSIGDAMIPYWASGILDRKSPANGFVSPDFLKDDLYYWHRLMYAQMVAQYRRARVDSLGQGTLQSETTLQKVAAIVFAGGAESTQFSNYVQQQRMSLLASKEPARFAANTIAAMFQPGDANSALVGGPDELWFWDAPVYFWITYPTFNRAASGATTQKGIDIARIAIEKRLFRRPARTVGEPFGSAVWTDHDTWNAANNLGDAFWHTSGALWWTVVGGNQLTAPCELDPFGGPLAAWLNPAVDITREHVLTAIRHWLTDHNLQCLEQTRTTLASIGL